VANTVRAIEFIDLTSGESDEDELHKIVYTLTHYIHVFVSSELINVVSEQPDVQKVLYQYSQR